MELQEKIYPMIDKLVDVLYNKEMNDLIYEKCQTTDEKRVFLMFIIMYFYSFLSISDINTSKYNLKIELKKFLNELIKNPLKRSKIIELYQNFENSTNILKNQFHRISN